jgi:hypothetical protein
LKLCLRSLKPLPFLGFSLKEIRSVCAIIIVAGTPRPSSLAICFVGYRRAMLCSFAISSSVHGLLIVYSHKPHRERQLDVPVPAFKAIREILEVEWDISHLQITPSAKLQRYVLGYVF